MVRPRLLLVVAALASLAGVGCRSKVTKLRDALVDDDGARVAHVVDTPPCTDASCLDAIARTLGARSGFNSNDPDQASAGAVALVVVRDRRGDLVPDADRWITAMTQAQGSGADALRVAVARGMADVAPRIDRTDDEAEVAKQMHAMAGVLPGACAAYARLGPIDALPPGQRPERSPCVLRDSERKDGPGAAYGRGVWRAAAGALALWGDAARALRAGLQSMAPAARPAVESRLAAIDAATARAAPKPR